MLNKLFHNPAQSYTGILWCINCRSTVHCGMLYVLYEYLQIQKMVLRINWSNNEWKLFQKRELDLFILWLYVDINKLYEYTKTQLKNQSIDYISFRSYGWTVFERHIRQTHSHDTQRVHTFGLNRTRMRASLCCSFIFGHTRTSPTYANAYIQSQLTYLSSKPKLWIFTNTTKNIIGYFDWGTLHHHMHLIIW